MGHPKTTKPILEAINRPLSYRIEKIIFYLLHRPATGQQVEEFLHHYTASALLSSFLSAFWKSLFVISANRVKVNSEKYHKGRKMDRWVGQLFSPERLDIGTIRSKVVFGVSHVMARKC